MIIKLLSSAVDDLRGAADFYEEQGEGLGVYFLESLFSDIDSILGYAGIHARVYGHHRLLSKRFPYAIYYTVDGDCAVIRRVRYTTRDPRRIRQALE